MARSFDAWLQVIEAMHPAAIEMGLDRVRAVARSMPLAAPARCVITVAGTNGKGSTVAFIEAVALAAGLRVGAYTSPHIRRFNERARVQGADVDDARWVAAFEVVEQARGDVPLTFFEFTTLAALHIFGASDLDLAVLEVGLGGRLDAVNLVDADVAVVTTVDIDHVDWLGADRESIGLEKAGIARAGKPLVIGDDDPPSSVLRRAYALGAPALRINSDYFYGPVDAAHWQWRALGDSMRLPLPRFLAPVQLRNAATAVTALKAAPLEIDATAYAEGMRRASVQGRLEPHVVDGIDLWFDVGHNPQAAKALASAFLAVPVSGRTHAVVAMLADKDAGAVAEALKPAVQRWHVAGLAGARGQSAGALAARLGDVAVDIASRSDTVGVALDMAISMAEPGDRVLVFGSFHTVAEGMDWLDARR